jgi:predicted transcriptional regulator
VAKLLMEKGVSTQDEFMEKIRAERATVQAMLQNL